MTCPLPHFHLVRLLFPPPHHLRTSPWPPSPPSPGPPMSRVPSVATNVHCYSYVADPLLPLWFAASFPPLPILAPRPPRLLFVSLFRVARWPGRSHTHLFLFVYSPASPPPSSLFPPSVLVHFTHPLLFSPTPCFHPSTAVFLVPLEIPTPLTPLVYTLRLSPSSLASS